MRRLEIRVGHKARANNEPLLPGPVPHVRLSVHGPKKDFSNAFTPFRLGHKARANNEPLLPGRVPHVRFSVHGPKKDFSNAFTPLHEDLALGRNPHPRNRSFGRARPSFSAHVR
jgi:hypothetical protein